MNARRRRLKPLKIFSLATDTDRKQGSTMKSAVKRDNFMLLGAKMFPAITTGKLECSLIRLTARVGEKYPLCESQVTKGFGQPQRRLIGHHVGQMPYFFSLHL